MIDAYLTNNFIARCKLIHKNKPYDYSKVSCTKFFDIVTINCTIHGDFNISAYSHVNGRGCKHCGNSLSQKEFANRLLKVNLELRSPYLGVRKVVKYFCEKHGESEDVAENLLNDGCRRCKYPYRLIEDFVSLFSQKYNGHPTFRYHNLKEPILCSTILDIYCLNCKTYAHPTVSNHLHSKTGCRVCWDGRRSAKQ